MRLDGKCLLLDLGRVLIGVNEARGFEALAKLAGRGPEEVANAIYGTDLGDAFGRGSVDAAGFRSRLCRTLGASMLDRAFDEAWCLMLEPLPQAEGLVQELASRHDLYLLSNTDPIHFDHVRRCYGSWIGLFKGLHLSYEVHLLKPEPAYFTTALDRFPLDRGRCVFLDDVAENVEAARSAGIRAHRVDTPGLSRRRLVGWGLLEYTTSA